MKMFKTIPVFILLFTGYLCNAQPEETPLLVTDTLPRKGHGTSIESSSPSPGMEIQGSDPVPARGLPSRVVAGVSIALALLCILIVAIFWYAWKKSQEGSIELNPIPYGEAGVSLRNAPGPGSQQEWPFQRAGQ
ncbi:uncharacterized protein M8220_004322 [Acridotheres tristis]